MSAQYGLHSYGRVEAPKEDYERVGSPPGGLAARASQAGRQAAGIAAGEPTRLGLLALQAMRSEIFRNGPIACSVATPDDFTCAAAAGPAACCTESCVADRLRLCRYGWVRLLGSRRVQLGRRLRCLLPAGHTGSAENPCAWAGRYRRGIWHDATSTRADIDHDVEVLGWGERDGRKFWKIRVRPAARTSCMQGSGGASRGHAGPGTRMQAPADAAACALQNSWGTFWGDRGYFELERGVNALFIEEQDCWVAGESSTQGLAAALQPAVAPTQLGCVRLMPCSPPLSTPRSAEPDFSMETAVAKGDYNGSMCVACALLQGGAPACLACTDPPLRVQVWAAGGPPGAAHAAGDAAELSTAC